MALTQALGKLTGDRRVVLELDLARGVLAARPDNPMQAVALINSPTLRSLDEHLEAAAKDPHVRGLIVHASAGLGLAVGEEIARLIEDFGRSRPTIAWADSFGELSGGLGAYRIAAACQQVWLQPTGMLSIEGLQLEITLLRGLFDKAGIVPQFGQRHEYKTAADQYAATEVTEANREMMQRIGTSIMETLILDIARLRGIDAETIRDAIDASPIDPVNALELGLIDKIGYRDQAYAAALEEWDAEPEDLVFVHRHGSRAALLKKLGGKKPKIAVVTLQGAIQQGRGTRTLTGSSNVGSDVVDEQLRQALRDDDVRAVVLAVDSPGGSAVASDSIRRSVLRLREAGKPVIASMGSVAASGGYYVAMGADEIVAQASTLTGSIGVVGGKFVTQGLYDKLGVIREALPFSEAAGTFSSASEFSDADWDRLNRWLDRIYLDFTTFAAHDRGMDYEDLEKLARGRVWTGADALERGLIDHLGGRRVAIERACLKAGLSPERAKVVDLGPGGVLSMLKPATSSEQAGSGAMLGSLESVVMGLAAQAGIIAPGVLTSPMGLRLR